MADSFEEDSFEEDSGETATLSNRGGVQRLELKKTAPADPDPELPAPPKQTENPLAFLAPDKTLGAAAHGVSQGVTLGFGDELMSAASADSGRFDAMRRASADVADAKARGTYDPGAASPQEAAELAEEQAGPSIADAYRKNRGAFREDLNTAKKEHPYAYLAGEVLGSMALPIPGGAAKGAAKVAQYAKTGAALGTVGGLGHSDADATRGDWSKYAELLKDTAWGGVSGAASGAALGKVADKADRWLSRMAERRAFKALDPYMKTMEPILRKKLGREPTTEEVMAEIQRLGRTVLDENVIPQGKLERMATSETLAKNAALKRDDAGKTLGGYISHLDDAGAANPVSMEEIAASMEAKALELMKDPAAQAVARGLMREAEAMRKAGVVRGLGGENPEALSLAAAEKLKRSMQGAVYGVDAARRGGPTQQAKEVAASLTRKAAEDAIERSSGPDELSIFRTLKNKYGTLDTIADTAGYGAARNFRNNAMSLGDQQLAQVGAAAGKTPLDSGLSAAAMALLNKIARERGSAAAARTLDNMSKSAKLSGPAALPWSSLLEEEQP